MTSVSYMRLALSSTTERENGIALIWGGVYSGHDSSPHFNKRIKREDNMTLRLLYLKNNKSF